MDASTRGTAAQAARPDGVFDPFWRLESTSLHNANVKKAQEGFSSERYNSQEGIAVQRWGEDQNFERTVKTGQGFNDMAKAAEDEYYDTAGTAGTAEDTTPPLTDEECCAWLSISAPSFVESGSTSGVSAGNKKGCVYYWSVEECNPTTWGCGTLTAASGGGTSGGLYTTDKGMVFIAPTIPETPANCGKTVDTKIKVSVLTADGKKQVAAEYGTGGLHGFGMGPGDELYDEFGPETVCDDTANITTNAHPCDELDECASVYIGYVTLAMTFYESQGFMAEKDGGFSGDHIFTWTLSGEGMLQGAGASGDGMAATGIIAEYKAPGYSPEKICTDYQASLSLYCDGVFVDRVEITIQGVFPDPVPHAGAYWWVTLGYSQTPSPWCAWGTWFQLQTNLIEVDCNGKKGPYQVLGYSGYNCWCSATWDDCVAEWVALGGKNECYAWDINTYGKDGCCPGGGKLAPC